MQALDHALVTIQPLLHRAIAQVAPGLLRLARGIAGPTGKIAVLDTEGGRTLHLKKEFKFDVMTMGPPFRPKLFADAAAEAEAAKYDVLLIDSFSQEWAGLGGVLSWQEDEIQRMAGDDFKKRERVKMASWIKPKTAHKAMVNALLQRRIPIVFSIRGEESVKPNADGGTPTKIFKPIMDSRFAFEVTVSFRLAQNSKGIIDLSDPAAWKMEGAHRDIFRHGEQLSEEHGARLAAWARGTPVESRASSPASPPDAPPAGAGESQPGPSIPDEPLTVEQEAELVELAEKQAEHGRDPFLSWVNGRTMAEQNFLRPRWKQFAQRF